MTTHAPSYYRDLLQRVVLMETADDLPQWFRRAWNNNDVQMVGIGPNIYTYVCSFAVEDKWLTLVKLKFSVQRLLDYYRVGDVGAYFIFGNAPKVAKVNAEWDSLRRHPTWGIKKMTDSISTITRESIPVEYEKVWWSWLAPNEARVEFSAPFKQYLQKQLISSAEQLWHWAEEMS